MGGSRGPERAGRGLTGSVAERLRARSPTQGDQLGPRSFLPPIGGNGDQSKRLTTSRRPRRGWVSPRCTLRSSPRKAKISHSVVKWFKPAAATDSVGGAIGGDSSRSFDVHHHANIRLNSRFIGPVRLYSRIGTGKITVL